MNDGHVDHLRCAWVGYVVRGPWRLQYTRAMLEREREEEKSTRRHALTANRAEACARADANLEERAVVLDESVKKGIKIESVHT